jgi:hypothetical protein
MVHPRLPGAQFNGGDASAHRLRLVSCDRAKLTEQAVRVVEHFRPPHQLDAESYRPLFVHIIAALAFGPATCPT